jgi:hypothetical protein
MFSRLTKLSQRHKDRSHEPSRSYGQTQHPWPAKYTWPKNHTASQTRRYEYAPTLELANLFCTKDIWRMHQTNALLDIVPNSSTPGFLAQIRRLLDVGANPSLLVNVYDVNGTNLHRLSGADVKVDFFEGSYTSCFEYCYILSTADDDWVPSTRQQKDLKLFLSCTRTPIADAVCAKDHEIVLLLTEHGARLGDFADSLNSVDRTGRSLTNDMKLLYAYNPFLAGCRSQGLCTVGCWN